MRLRSLCLFRKEVRKAYQPFSDHNMLTLTNV